MPFLLLFYIAIRAVQGPSESYLYAQTVVCHPDPDSRLNHIPRKRRQRSQALIRKVDSPAHMRSHLRDTNSRQDHLSLTLREHVRRFYQRFKF
jgi:hypothetical protein